MKVCSRCHIEKEDCCFCKLNRNSEALQSYCKSCARKRHTEYRRKKGIPELKRKDVYILPDTKVCSKCDTEKTKDNFRIRVEKRCYPSFPYLNNICKKCDARIAKEYHLKNKDNPEYKKKQSEKSISRYWDNPEKFREENKNRRSKIESKETRKIYISKNKEKIYRQENLTKRRYHIKNRDNLTDQYVAAIIAQGVCKTKEILKEKDIIETYREHIKLKRLCQQLSKQ